MALRLVRYSNFWLVAPLEVQNLQLQKIFKPLKRLGTFADACQKPGHGTAVSLQKDFCSSNRMLLF
jgi:hypothetical protein